VKAKTYSTPTIKRSGEDEKLFWVKYPRASRYWNPDEREMITFHIPHWVPGSDIGELERQRQRVDVHYRAPQWNEWERIRREWRQTHPGAQV